MMSSMPGLFASFKLIDLGANLLCSRAKGYRRFAIIEGMFFFTNNTNKFLVCLHGE